MVTKNPDIFNRKSGCFGCLKKIVYTVLVVLLRYFYIKLHRKRKPWVQGDHEKTEKNNALRQLTSAVLQGHGGPMHTSGNTGCLQ